MNKYRNRQTLIDGIRFASMKEAKRYKELKLLERAGEIKDLELQKEFVLLPAQKEQYTEITKTGKERIKEKTIERKLSYFADFCYTDKNGKYVVEDTKGIKTKEYIIKRKLMLYFHGIKITEI